MDGWIVAIILGQLVFTGWILWIIAYFRINKSKQRSEERLRVLERFGSSQEMADFLASEGGDKLLAHFVPKAASPRTWTLIALSAGLISIFLGVGFLILAELEIFGDPDIFTIPGVLSCLGGAGMLTAAAVTTWLIGRWDLDKDQEPAL